MIESKLSIRCIGTGDAFGTGGRLNSCYHLSWQGQQLLLDCGSSSLIGMHRYGIDIGKIDTIIISHLHGDHFGGIPYLLLEGKYSSQRTRLLTLIGPPELQQQVEIIAEGMYPGLIGKKFPFPIKYRQLNPHQPEQIGSILLKSFYMNHGSSKYAYGLRLEAGDKVISYTGDTQWTNQLIPLAQGSDLLIAECYAYDQPVPSHLDYKTLLAQRKKIASKRIVLTHLGSDMLAQKGKLEFELLNDGDLIEI